jgi:hypothetical protein
MEVVDLARQAAGDFSVAGEPGLGKSLVGQEAIVRFARLVEAAVGQRKFELGACEFEALHAAQDPARPADAAAACSLQEHPFMRVGDWVATRVEPGYELNTPIRIARVKDVYRDPVSSRSNKWLVDLVLYSRDGTRIGRESPAMGGPRNLEPACHLEFWSRIEKPDFEELEAYRHKSLMGLLQWIPDDAA